MKNLNFASYEPQMLTTILYRWSVI